VEGLEKFYKNKKVLVTGHTGFKGAWLSIWLNELGAKVIGYALDPEDKEGIFEQAKVNTKLIDIRADIRDFEKLKKVFQENKPDLVFHLAAQPLVRDSYDRPLYTFETNVIGTVNVMECARIFGTRATVLITTDKCYKNKGSMNGYKETDELGGNDPYSASKACAELAITSYENSFFKEKEANIASTRAGNVIGGGDWAKDRILPDCIRALEKKEPIGVRNPNAIRPWQFVLEPLYGYLVLGKKLFEDKKYMGAWNFGPASESIITVKEVVEKVIMEWKEGSWKHVSEKQHKKPEAALLNLDYSKAKEQLGWNPVLNINKAISMTAEWYKKFRHEDPYELSRKQICQYMEQ